MNEIINNQFNGASNDFNDSLKSRVRWLVQFNKYYTENQFNNNNLTNKSVEIIAKENLLLLYIENEDFTKFAKEFYRHFFNPKSSRKEQKEFIEGIKMKYEKFVQRANNIILPNNTIIDYKLEIPNVKLPDIENIRNLDSLLRKSELIRQRLDSMRKSLYYKQNDSTQRNTNNKNDSTQ